jgi:hypothetical protein
MGEKLQRYLRHRSDEFNAAYFAGLPKYGIKLEHVAQAGCYSYGSTALAHPDALPQ